METVILVGAIITLLSRPIFMGDRDKALMSIALTLLGFFYVPYLFSFLFKILFWPGSGEQGLGLLLYLAAVTKMTDVGAYITGSLVGRHKMNPVISPKKTWEGFVGGLLFAVGVSYLLAYLMPETLGFIYGWHLVTIALMIAVVGVVGDLVESLIKRSSGIKDSGRFVPGIGGALDLVDSLLFTAPVFYCYLLFLRS